jgi:hypothetical protein
MLQRNIVGAVPGHAAALLQQKVQQNPAALE